MVLYTSQQESHRKLVFILAKWEEVFDFYNDIIMVASSRNQIFQTHVLELNT